MTKVSWVTAFLDLPPLVHETTDRDPWTGHVA
jgi:hypothetical protein